MVTTGATCNCNQPSLLSRPDCKQTYPHQGRRVGNHAGVRDKMYTDRVPFVSHSTARNSFMTSSSLTPSELQALRDENVSRGVVTAHPLFVERAKGSRVWTTDGKEYLDFVGGIGVMNVGHNNDAVVDAVKKQLERVTHMAFQVAGYDVYVDLAARLNKLIGKGSAYKSVFLTTGAEAVENAVKIARAYRKASGIIAFRGGFHGRTLM